MKKKKRREKEKKEERGEENYKKTQKEEKREKKKKEKKGNAFLFSFFWTCSFSFLMFTCPSASFISSMEVATL